MVSFRARVCSGGLFFYSTGIALSQLDLRQTNNVNALVEFVRVS